MNCAGEPYARRSRFPSARSSDRQGVGLTAQWAPNTLPGRAGSHPPAFQLSNLTGALRFRVATSEGPWNFGLERLPVADSLLSLGGATDPLTGREWGGVTRNRAYFGGNFGGEDLTLYGEMAGAIIDGHGVDNNSLWEAEAGFWKRAGTGDHWLARFGGNAKAAGYDDNRSHFTIGHGGYFSPSKFLAVGPTFDLRGGRAATIFRLEGGIAWQVVRESSSEFFPKDSAWQAPIGAPYSATLAMASVCGSRGFVRWRVFIARFRACVSRCAGEDFDEVRLQVMHVAAG